MVEDTGKKMSDLYKYVGYSRQSSKNYKDLGTIPIKHAKAISNFLNISVDTLLSSGLVDDLNADRIIYVDNDSIELPTIYAGAGAVGYAVDEAEKRCYPNELIPPHVAVDKNALVIIVAGNSMEPLYYENDIVLIDMVNGRDFIKIDGTYLVRYGDTIQIKDIKFLGNTDIMISSRNDRHTFMVKKDLGIDDWEIIGKPYVSIHATVGGKLKIG